MDKKMQLIMQDTEARSFNANLRRMVAFSIGEADYNPSSLATARGCGGGQPGRGAGG